MIQTVMMHYFNAGSFFIVTASLHALTYTVDENMINIWSGRIQTRELAIKC